MQELLINKISKGKQFVYSIAIVCVISLACFILSGFMGYKVVAFILLVTVSLLAMNLDIFPVLVAAALSALVWDFFFIPPHSTFQISSQDDVILLTMYFIIAMVNAVLTYKLRQIEKVARQKEEKANTIKLYNTVLNSLSHELKTPIATIIGATDNLHLNSSKLSATHRSELISEISQASFRLNQQVENLLNMSRIDSGSIQPRKDWCDISEIIYESVKRVENNEISQQISISINPSIPLFKLDKGMFEQIVYNLINNASQYSHAESLIKVSATSYVDLLEVIIEDNGPGFPKEEIDKVFEKFYRLKNSKTGGTGLGLSIVKGFVEALGGSILLENVPGGGAKFTVIIKAQTSLLKVDHE